MEKYFWREKNANKFIGKNEVVLPTREELEKELILKFEQKLSRIDIIFDKNARMQYYLNDKKPKNLKLEGLTEEEIQKSIGSNVVVDFIQVTRDICEFYEIDFGKLKNVPPMLSRDEMQKSIGKEIENLKNHQNTLVAVNNIYLCSLALANLLKLDMNIIEQERKEKESLQGNFYKGKYVIFDKL